MLLTSHPSAMGYGLLPCLVKTKEHIKETSVLQMRRKIVEVKCFAWQCQLDIYMQQKIRPVTFAPVQPTTTIFSS
jgi:hypothetical protein